MTLSRGARCRQDAQDVMTPEADEYQLQPGNLSQISADNVNRGADHRKNHKETKYDECWRVN